MVTTEYLGMDFSTYHLVAGIIAHEEIVDAPTSVLLACPEAITPPRIHALHIGVEKTPTVGKAAIEQYRHFLTLLIGKTCVLTVTFGILEVNLLMCHIEVSTHYHWLIKTLETILTVRHIHVHEIELIHLKRDDAPLMIMLVNADA